MSLISCGTLNPKYNEFSTYSEVDLQAKEKNIINLKADALPFVKNGKYKQTNFYYEFIKDKNSFLEDVKFITESDEQEFFKTYAKLFDKKFLEKNNLIYFEGSFIDFNSKYALDSVSFEKSDVILNSISYKDINGYESLSKAFSTTHAFIYFPKDKNYKQDTLKLNIISSKGQYWEYRKKIPWGTLFKKF